MPLRKIVVQFTMALPLFAAQNTSVSRSLIVHEWGTFTSVAGEDGTSVRWAPLSGSPDLPCFVHRLSTQNLKLALGLVRMETPVIYFYSPRALTASVRVEFPQGWITEWYPNATRISPVLPRNPLRFVEFGKGQIEWDSFRITPFETPALPEAGAGSRYFAARNTDSTPLTIGSEQEKFIFYRGVGNFTVPLQAKFLSESDLEIRTSAAPSVPLVIVFENRDGNASYQFLRDIHGVVHVDASEGAGSLQDLGQKMIHSLVEFGLYEKEAAAMLETWGDAWFTEGTRIFYIVPAGVVDSVLSLTVAPAPVITKRVFVGRLEILSPGERQALKTALVTGDAGTIAQYGRFLDAFLRQLNRETLESPFARPYIQQVYQQLAGEFNSASCVQ